MRKKVNFLLKIFISCLILPFFAFVFSYNLEAASGEELLTVEFAVESKTPVMLGEDTMYDGWGNDEGAAIYISIKNLDVSKVYQLVISMDPVIFVPVETLPVPSGAVSSFVKNDDILINGTETLAINEYSGTITYTFNSSVDKTIEIENFRLQLDYSEMLWNKLANTKLAVGDGNLLSVKLVEGENTLDTKNLVDATTSKAGIMNTSSGIKIDTANNYSYMPNEINGRINNTLNWRMGVTSSSTYEGQYYRKLTCDIELPSTTVNGTKYYLQYNLDDFNLLCLYNGVVDKDLYSIDASESNIIFEVEDYYYRKSGFISGNFTYPQDKVFTDNPGEYTFNGSITFYADGDENAVVAKYNFITTLNTVEEAKFNVFQMGSGSVSVDYNMPDYVQRIGGYGLSNSGTDSGRLKISVLFDTNLDDNERVLATSFELFPEYKEKNITIKYSLIDENSNQIYFDSEGNVVPKDTAGATEYWTVTIKSDNYNKTTHALSYYTLFTREMLIPEHQQYYFRTIEYIHSGILQNQQYWNDSWSQGYTKSPGTFWGYTKTTAKNKTVSSVVKIYQEDLNGEFILEEDLTRTFKTKAIVSNVMPMGLKDIEVSDTSIEAGDLFTIEYTAFVVGYPYTVCNVVNTEDRNLILGFKLPVGVTINESGTVITNSNGKKNIPIIDITYEPIDNEFNLWRIELQGGKEYEIGYATEGLTKIPNGDSIKCKVEFNTSLAIPNTTVTFLSSVFVSATGMTNKPGGSNKYYVQPDLYDVNNNGITTGENVGGFNSNSDSNIMLQIIDKLAKLDITDSLSVNNSKIEEEAVINNNTDIIEYQLEIECTSGGSAEDFAYYIPIIKNNSVVDNQIIFNAEYAYTLSKEVEVANSIEGIGVKVLYGFEEAITFTKANSQTMTWYETIPSDKTLADVTVLKIVPQTNAIENGSISVIKVTMNYLGSTEEYIENAGMNNTWAARGQYKYKIGDRSVVGLYSTKKTSITTHYTYDKQIVTLKTSTGDHSDFIGNDTYTLDGLYKFSKTQNFKVASISTYNSVLTSVINMEMIASNLTGDDANRLFAFYAKINSNPKQDISDTNCVLGVVDASTAFNIVFEIFNADVISDTTTIRYVDIILESDNGVTIPIRINIERELTIIGEVSNGIVSGKQYLLFPANNKQVTISKDSAFTLQFSAENLIPDNYLSRKIVFDTALPANTTITLIDWTNSTNIKYYYYQTTSSDTETIELTSFYVMGSKVDKYVNTTGNDAITEKLLFIIDLADNNTITSGTTNSVNLVRILNSNKEEASPDVLSYTVLDNRAFELTIDSEKDLGETIEVEYTVSDITYSDSNYNDQKLALSIKPTSTLSVDDAKIIYNGTTYYLNSNNEFIIPLNNVQSAGTYNISFAFYSESISYHNGDCKLDVTLLASATANAKAPHMGKELKTSQITLTTNIIPSIKVESMSNRWLTKDDLNDIVNLTYSTKDVNGKVTIELQQKIGEGYVTDSTLLEAVNGSTAQVGGQFDITNTKNLSMKFSNRMVSGQYQVLISVYDTNGNKLTEVAYKFMVIE